MKIIKDSLPGQQGDPGRTGDDNRRFIEAVMRIARPGVPWRDLPPEYGKWFGFHKRFVRCVAQPACRSLPQARLWILLREAPQTDQGRTGVSSQRHGLQPEI